MFPPFIGLLTAGFKLFGDEHKLADNAISHLFDIYVKTNNLVAENPDVMKRAQEACQQLEQGKLGLSSSVRQISRFSTRKRLCLGCWFNAVRCQFP